MAWIQSHQSLAAHPKLDQLCRLLGVSKPQAIGHLHLLWWFALEYAQDGDLTDLDRQYLARVSGWDGDADRFMDALVQCRVRRDGAGFVDQVDDRLLLHHWDDYAGKLVDRRRMDAQRKRVDRMTAGHPDPIPRTSTGRPPDVQTDDAKVKTDVHDDPARTSTARVEKTRLDKIDIHGGPAGSLRDRFADQYRTAKDDRERVAALGMLYQGLFDKAPDFGRLGMMRKQLNSGGRLAKLMWAAAGEQITDDPLDYLQAMVKRVTGGNGRRPAPDLVQTQPISDQDLFVSQAMGLLFDRDAADLTPDQLPETLRTAFSRDDLQAAFEAAGGIQQDWGNPSHAAKRLAKAWADYAKGVTACKN